jgi:HlyD family secretion protein
MSKRVRIGVAVVLAIAVGVTAWRLTAAGEGEHEALTASGTIEATDADLGFQAPGRVLEIAVREGDRVEQGQVLARLDTREVEAAVAAARAQVAAAEARLAELRRGARPQEVASAESAAGSAERRAGEAAREAERARTLHAGGAISRQALDRAETAAEVAAAGLVQAREQLGLVREGPRAESIRAQEALVAQARANVELAEATLANGTVVAPFAGVVTTRHREPGEAVSPGAPVLTLLDPDDRWVRIYVREDVVGRVQLGMTASVTSDTYPERTFDGEVVFIASEAEFTPRNVQTAEERTKLVYAVKVRITSDPDFILKPGIPADVRLVERGS